MTLLPAPTEEVEEAEAGRTPSIGGLALPEAEPLERGVLVADEVAVGRVRRPAVPLAIRPAAVVLVPVATEGAGRPAAPGAIDCLERAEAVFDGGAADLLIAEVAEVEAVREQQLYPLDLKHVQKQKRS